MAAGHVADGKGHGEHSQSECEGDPDESNPEAWKGGRQYRAAAATEYEP